MKFNIESAKESIRSRWAQVQKYIPIFLATIATIGSVDKVKAQTGDSFTEKGEPKTTIVKTGDGSKKNPWEHKLPQAMGDPMVEEHNRAARNPEREKEAHDEMRRTILEKRAKQRLKVSEENLKIFDEETEALFLSIATGIVDPRVYFRDKAQDDLEADLEEAEEVVSKNKNK